MRVLIFFLFVFLRLVDLEFKIIYVGSAETFEFDQVLDQIVVDAVPQGQFKFMFQADPPDISKIPADDAVGVTVVLITASYREQEFVRVGYYVTNEYDEPELRENPPVEPQFSKLIRTIADKEPRVTKFKINWDSANSSSQTNNPTAGTSSSTSAGADEMDIAAATDKNSAANPALNSIENNQSVLNQQQQQLKHSNSANNGVGNDFKMAPPVGVLNQNIENSYDSIMS
jgi:histone chaperone ASF1